jgi:hypothetical protein
MNADSQLRRDDASSAVGSDALAEGLMLVRASTLKMIRLQLAMERKDRRVALEAVDDLVALDRRLQDYLADVTAPELEVERAALNREKLTLAAEVIRAEPKPPPGPQVAEPVAAEKWVALEEERPHRTAWWLVAVLVLLSVVAAAAYWFAGPEILGAIA